MGSVESQLESGETSGDSQGDDFSPQFLTPDLLERAWLDLVLPDEWVRLF